MQLRKIMSLSACLCKVSGFGEFQSLDCLERKRSWNVLCWGNPLSAGFADMRRQQRTVMNSSIYQWFLQIQYYEF